MRRARHGFTLVEMAVAVGLVLLVMGIAGAVSWSYWRGFTGGVASAQSMQAAGEALEWIAQDLACAPLSRTDDIKLIDGAYRFPLTIRRKSSRVAGVVSWKLVPRRGGGLELQRDGQPVLRGANVLSLTLRPLTSAGPIAVEIEATDGGGRARARMRKLVDIPRLRQRARYAGTWEDRAPTAKSAGGPS